MLEELGNIYNKGIDKIRVSKEASKNLSEPKIELNQVEQLITQGKVEEVLELIARREKTEGIVDLRWRIIESRCRNRRGEYDQVIKNTEEIIEEIDKEEPVDLKGL
jgi:hypothetical protein